MPTAVIVIIGTRVNVILPIVAKWITTKIHTSEIEAISLEVFVVRTAGSMSFYRSSSQ
jgi:hypothetical protein